MSTDDTLHFGDRVSIAVLVISVVALIGVALQYLQIIQGRTTLDESVLGLWASKAGWKLRMLGLKLTYKLEYEAPVIFLAPSDNQRWPVDNSYRWVLSGSRKSFAETRVVEPPDDPEDEDAPNPVREHVHTVKNELASWIKLLEAAQKMERDSRRWEIRSWSAANERQPDLPAVTSLSVVMQPATRILDSTLRRPYATTTMCHLVELCAVLGLYWREFNRDQDKYRAEGNGYIMMGKCVPDSGIVFTFEKTGWPRFRKARIIPTSEVKELCFGNVPTFWRPRHEDRHWDSHWSVALNEQRRMEIMTLQLGSHREIGETLNLIGCNEYSIQCYSGTDRSRRHIHLFPVIFEVVGMLARCLHIRKRPFTYLPNPVIFPLNKQAFSMPRLLSEFRRHLNDQIENTYVQPPDLLTIQTQVERLAEALGHETEYKPPQLEKIHDAIDEIDGIWTHTTKSIVLDVLRRHLQEVLSALNTHELPEINGNNDGNGNAYDNGAASPPLRDTFSSDILARENISLDSLQSVPLEHREGRMMHKYFAEIRLRVINVSDAHHDPLATIASRDIHRSDPDFTPASPQAVPQANRPQQPNPAAVQRNTVWCALIFRMICWLLLHDFDRKDVQLPRSELMGSRLCVFIV